MKSSKSEYKVRAEDTNIFGVTHYANYLHFFDLGFNDLFDNLFSGGYAGLVYEGRIRLPVVEAFCRYTERLVAGDVLETHTTARIVGEKAVRLEFRLYKKDEGKLAAEGYIVCVNVNREWKSVSIPSDIVSAIGE